MVAWRKPYGNVLFLITHIYILEKGHDLVISLWRLQGVDFLFVCTGYAEVVVVSLLGKDIHSSPSIFSLAPWRFFTGRAGSYWVQVCVNLEPSLVLLLLLRSI